MVQYILGNYFVKTGKLTGKQLKDVLEKQDKTRVKLGLIAQSEGLMNEKQTAEVNRLQATLDKRFGDIAVEKGYLTEEQVDRLLKLQGNPYLAFVQTIVDEGLMTAAEVDDAVSAYRIEKGYGASEIDDLKSGEVDRILPLYLTGKSAEYLDIAGVAIRTMIRFIDRNLYIGDVVQTGDTKLKNAAVQSIQGEQGWKSAFAEEDGGLVLMASIFAKDDFKEVDEDVLDSAGEFLNCINGLYASALSYKSIHVELLPPAYTREETVIKGNNVCLMPIYIQDKKLLFVISK